MGMNRNLNYQGRAAARSSSPCRSPSLSPSQRGVRLRRQGKGCGNCRGRCQYITFRAGVGGGVRVDEGGIVGVVKIALAAYYCLVEVEIMASS